MSPHDGPRHDRTITQSDSHAPVGASEGRAADAYDEADGYDEAYDEYGQALYDDEPQEQLDDEVANAGWSMWDDEWHGPRHGPPSQPTAAAGAPGRSDAYRTGGAGAVRMPGPPTPATGQGAVVGGPTGATRAAAPAWRPPVVLGVVALWVSCLVGGLLIGASTGSKGGEPDDRLVTVRPEEVEGDWRDAAVPGGPAASQPPAPGDDPGGRPQGQQGPTTTPRPDVTRPSTTTTTERDPAGDTTTTTEPEETTTTSAPTTTTTTAPTTTTTTAPTTTTTTVAGAAALRSVLPF